MNIYELITIVVSAVTIIISLFALAFSIKSYFYPIKETKLLRAPLLFLEAETLGDLTGKYSFVESQSNIEGSRNFILDRRIIENNTPSLKEDEKIEGPFISLYLNFCNKSNFSEKKSFRFVNFATMHFKNIGYDLVSFEITSIHILLKNDLSFTLNPTEHNKLNTYIPTKETIDIMLTEEFYDDEYAFADIEKMKNLQLIDIKKLVTNNQILNTYLPDVPDLWERITIKVNTTNIHNEKYLQEVIVMFKDCMFTAESILIEN